MAKTLNARIITKHDTEANWKKAVSFIPKQGEIIVYEAEYSNDNLATQVPRIKIGNGIDTINILPFINDPYVLKDGEKKLSTNDYTQKHYDIVNEIANLNYKPIYTDTTYTGGKGIGLTENNSFYNLGIIDIRESNSSESAEKGTFKCIISTGPNSADYEERKIKIAGLTETAFTPLSNFLTSGSFEKINKSIISIEPSTEPGSIIYTNAINEKALVRIPGLGKLAFKDGFDGDFAEVTEVAIQGYQPYGNIPIWIQPTENKGILKFYDTITKTYKDINTGYFTKVYNTYLPNGTTVKDITFETQDDSIIISTGVTDIKREDSKQNRLTVVTNGITDYINIDPNITFKTGTTNGTFIVNKNGADSSVQIYGLGSNAFSSEKYLPLEGNSVVNGIVSFANTSMATSTNTGAVRISGGLGVAGSIYGSQVYGAVYNDYAEYRQAEEQIEPGYIVYSDDNGILHKTKNRLQHFEGVVSDTFGFAIGKTDKAKTPLAVAGRVLVYTNEELHAGDVVCAGENGKACKMSEEEIANKPDRIVGIVSEIPTYDTWGEDNVPVNKRVWIRVK